MKLANMYSGISEKTLIRDIEELIKFDILKKQGDTYEANIVLLNRMFAKNKSFLIKQ